MRAQVMQKTAVALLFGLCGGLALSADATPAAPVPRAPEGIRQTEGPSLSARLENLERNYSLLACPMELRQLVSAVRANCAREAAATPPKLPVLSVPSPGGAAPESRASLGPQDSRGPSGLTNTLQREVCPSALVQDSIAYPQRSWKVKLEELLLKLPHVALYPSADLREPSLGRRRALEALLGTPFLASTRLLILTGPDRAPEKPAASQGSGSEQGALWRLRWTLEWLLRREVPAERIEPPWIYDAQIPIKGMDQHMHPETDDVRQVTWLVRIDC